MKSTQLPIKRLEVSLSGSCITICSNNELLLWNLDEEKIIQESFQTSLLAVKIMTHIKHNQFKNHSTSSLIVAVTKFKELLYSNILYYNWANTEIRFNNWQEIGKGKFQDIDMYGDILYQQKSAEVIVYNPFIEKKIFKNFLTKCHHHYSCRHGVRITGR